jgi:hypothetical protein
MNDTKENFPINLFFLHSRLSFFAGQRSVVTRISLSLLSLSSSSRLFSIMRKHFDSLLVVLVLLVYTVAASPSGSGEGHWENQSTPALGRSRRARSNRLEQDEVHVDTPALRNFNRAGFSSNRMGMGMGMGTGMEMNRNWQQPEEYQVTGMETPIQVELRQRRARGLELARAERRRGQVATYNENEQVNTYPYHQVDQLNPFNQLNQFNQLDQFSQLNQSNQLNQLNQFNQWDGQGYNQQMGEQQYGYDQSSGVQYPGQMNASVAGFGSLSLQEPKAAVDALLSDDDVATLQQRAEFDQLRRNQAANMKTYEARIISNSESRKYWYKGLPKFIEEKLRQYASEGLAYTEKTLNIQYEGQWRRKFIKKVAAGGYLDVVIFGTAAEKEAILDKLTEKLFSTKEDVSCVYVRLLRMTGLSPDFLLSPFHLLNRPKSSTKVELLVFLKKNFSKQYSDVSLLYFMRIWSTCALKQWMPVKYGL